MGKLVEYRKADAQGKGVPVTDSEGKTVEGQYLITWPLNNNGVEKDMLELMLPFGAIDETVRSGGSYIIHYNLKTATVLDVFYSDASDKRFGTNLGADTDNFTYQNLTDDAKGDEKRNNRRNFKDTGKVVGWYGGGDDLEPYEVNIKQPVITVNNGDTLSVTIPSPEKTENARKEYDIEKKPP